jgi:hypothetical protein
MTTLLSTLLLALAPAHAERPWADLDHAATWEPVTTRNTEVGEVVVHYKRLGEQDCVQGVLVTALPVAQLQSAVNDINGSKDWSEQGLAASEVLDMAAHHVDFYQVMDVPDWTMASDRWWLLRAYTHVDADGTPRFRWYRLDAATAYPEVHASVVARFPRAIEMPVNWGEWVFQPDDTGKTRASYRVCTSLGGSLPAWIQRMAIRRTLPDSIVDLVRAAEGRAK